jgi:hypothetical protein
METWKMAKIQDIVDSVMSIRGCSAATLTFKTVPTMNKGGRKDKVTGEYPNKYLGRVEKISTINGMVGANYANAVRKATEDESFEPGPLPWGERVGESPLITHKGNLYLQIVKPNWGKSEWLVDGRKATDDEIEEIKTYLPNKAEQEVVVRAFNLNGVQRAAIGGKVLTFD